MSATNPHQFFQTRISSATAAVTTGPRSCASASRERTGDYTKGNDCRAECRAGEIGEGAKAVIIRTVARNIGPDFGALIVCTPTSRTRPIAFTIQEKHIRPA
jgi:hypothetical protein